MELGAIGVLGALALLAPLWFGISGSRAASAPLRLGRLVWAGLTLALLALAGGLYWSTGTLQDVRLHRQMAQPPDNLRELLQRHLHRWPDRAGFRYALTQLLADAEEWQPALEQLNLLAERYPTEVPILLERTSIHMRVHGADSRSAEQVQTLLSLAPESPEVLRLAGLHALAQGDRDRALRHWSQLVERLPEAQREPARALLQRLRASPATEVTEAGEMPEAPKTPETP